jgi:hypothetical protein
MRASCLSIHAQYQCRHAGVCCRTWTVPAEPHVVRIVDERRLRPPGVNGPLFIASGNPDPYDTVIAKHQNGGCVFFEHHRPVHRSRGEGGCVIHREAGVGALPTACRHFPRKFLRDSRGTFISLSHFCPTAACLLFDAPPLEIVEARAPLMIEEPIEGLDARNELPPLLRPDVLCDPDGYDAWERASLAVLADDDLAWHAALDRIAAATERVRSWTPGAESLAARVVREFSSIEDRAAPRIPDRALLELVWRLSGDAADHAPTTLEDLKSFDAAMKNFLAARLFGNWIAYQGRGLRSIVQWLRAAAALVRDGASRLTSASTGVVTQDDVREAVRTTDLILLHGIDTQTFARAVADIEHA